MKKSLQREEKQRALEIISEDICERNTRTPVLKATLMCPMTGVTTIIETRNKIVEASV